MRTSPYAIHYTQHRQGCMPIMTAERMYAYSEKDAMQRFREAYPHICDRSGRYAYRVPFRADCIADKASRRNEVEA